MPKRSKSSRKRPRSRLTSEQIGQLYDKLIPIKKISARAGISEKAVRGHIRKTGRTLRPRSPWTIEQLAELYFGKPPDQPEHSLQEIQDITGICVSTISIRLKRAKHKLRGRGNTLRRPKNRKVKTADLISAFNEMRESGKKINLAEIARRFHTSRALVAQRLERAKIYSPSRPHKIELSPEQLVEAKRMYEEPGGTLEAVSKHFGIGLNTLQRKFIANHIKIRSKSEQMRIRHAERNAKLATIDADRLALLEKLEELKLEAERIRAEAKPKEARRLGGRPKGMTNETREEAQLLERHMRDFEKEHGTKRGALIYASRKVYGSALDPLKATRRGTKTLSRYRAIKSGTIGQKPAA